MTHPTDLRYTDKHVWVRGREKLVTVGITQEEADRLGAVSFAELPYPGELLKTGEVLARLSGASASGAVRMPFTGKIMEVNRLLDPSPGVVNDDPYGKGWILKMEPGDPAHVDELLDAAGYEAALATQDG